MLYLIRTFGRGKNKTALKVGYAKNIEERMRTYYHHNPYFELITTREGELYDEMVLHLYLQCSNLKLGILNEWFLDEDEVIQKFHTQKDKMLREIWKHRQDLFSIPDFKTSGNELRRRIYEDLRMTMYQEDKSKEIDRLWKQELNKTVLKKMKEEHYGRKMGSLYF